MKTFTSYQNDIPRIINNNSSDNLLWATEAINDSLRYLTTKYFFNERSYTTTTVAQQQFYPQPPFVKKLINATELIGSVLWSIKECPTRAYWDALNVITFYQDFPSFFFVYNSQIGVYPIPASSGNTLTFNYKTRIVDLVQPDVTNATSSQTVTATNGSTTITATGNVFLNWMVNQWIRIPYAATNAASGDNEWYQIASVTSATVALLAAPYQGASCAGANFTIGQVPILPEDYQDLPLYRMALIYYTTRFPDPVRAQLYQKLYDDGEAKLNDEFGSKTSSVEIQDVNAEIVNPNLFVRLIS